MFSKKFQDINFSLFLKERRIPHKSLLLSFSFPQSVSYGPSTPPLKAPVQSNPRTYASILRIWSPAPFQWLLSPALNPEDVALMESHTKAQKCLHAAFSQHLKAVICCNWDNREFSLLVFVFFFSPPFPLLMIRFSTVFCNRIERDRDPINCFKGLTVPGGVLCHLTFFFFFCNRVSQTN